MVHLKETKTNKSSTSALNAGNQPLVHPQDVVTEKDVETAITQQDLVRIRDEFITTLIIVGTIIGSTLILYIMS